ncbi:hypothetical protein ACQBAU_13180 [Propionibacteriaceae bacterium Y2011]|uniref:COG1470 family protein n=1 Tax=Microlunatus sp. Y2014 TaxID=3418488 RepID=UPI003B4A4DAF
MNASRPFELTVDLSVPEVRVKPGGQAKVAISIRNIGQVVQHYRASLLGLPADELWATDVDVIKLRPGETGVINLELRIPQPGQAVNGRVLAGSYLLGVLVQSPYQPEVSRSAELSLEVETIAGVHMSVQPEVVEARTEGHVVASLQNQGNSGMHLKVVPTDDQGRAEFITNPPQLWLPAGGTSHVQVSWKVPGFFTGQPKTSAVTLAAHSPEGVQQESRISFVQRPTVPTAVLTSLGVVLAVLVVAGAILASSVLGPILNPPATPEVTQPPTTQGPVEEPPSSSGPTEAETSASGAEPPGPPQLMMTPAAPIVGTDLTVTAETTEQVTAWDWKVTDGGNNVVANATTPQTFTWRPETAGAFTLTVMITTEGGTSTSTLDLTVTLPPVASVAEEVDLPSGLSSHEVSCADGSTALNGGADFPTAVGQVGLVESGPKGNGWIFSFTNLTGPTKANLVVICVTPIPGMEVVREQVAVAANTGKVLEARCPDGRVVLGGGAGIVLEGVSADPGIVMESWPDRDSAETPWRYWRAVISAEEDIDAQVWALCAPSPPGHAVEIHGRAVQGEDAIEDFKVTCEQGVLVGAGLALDRHNPPPGADPKAIILASRPTIGAPDGAPTEWTMVALYTLAEEHHVNAFSICLGNSA